MLHKKNEKNIDFEKIGKEVLNIEIENLKNISNCINTEFSNICKKILYCQGKVITMGIGKSGHIARKIAATFSSIGSPAFFVHPAEASHGDLGVISKKDIIIIISHSGESIEIVNLISSLKRLKIFLISITSHPKSTIACAADINLSINITREACPLELTPTSSVTAVSVVGDAIAISLLKARNFSTRDFILSHPGGNLGKKLIQIKDTMRTGNRIPYVKNEASLYDAIMEIMYKYSDVIAICDDNMKIKNIFTKNDICSILKFNADPQKIKINKIPTMSNSTFTHPNTYVVDAINIMQNNNIISILVVDNNQLLGIAYLDDLL